MSNFEHPKMTQEKIEQIVKAEYPDALEIRVHEISTDYKSWQITHDGTVPDIEGVRFGANFTTVRKAKGGYMVRQDFACDFPV